MCGTEPSRVEPNQPHPQRVSEAASYAAAPTEPEIAVDASASAAENIRECEQHFAKLEEDLKTEQDSEYRKALELMIGEASTRKQHLRETKPRTNRESNRKTKAKKRRGRLGG